MQASGLCLVLLSKHQDAFHSLSDGAKRLQAELQGEGTTQVQLPTRPLISACAAGRHFSGTATPSHVYAAACAYAVLAANEFPASLQVIDKGYWRGRVAVVSA